VGPNERRYWNAAVRDWVTDTATFDVWVGGDSTAELAGTFEIRN
jgi:beta-glucosidase